MKGRLVFEWEGGKAVYVRQQVVGGILDSVCKYVCKAGNKYLNSPTNIWYLQSALRFVKAALTSLIWFELGSGVGRPFNFEWQLKHVGVSLGINGLL